MVFTQSLSTGQFIVLFCILKENEALLDDLNSIY